MNKYNYFECLWKKSVFEIIDTDKFKGQNFKIALVLANQNINKKDQILLEENNWSILEIENIMELANNEELKNYILNYFQTFEKSNEIFEEKLIKYKNEKIIKDENIDAFLNS